MSVCRTVASLTYSSLRTHRALIAISTRFRLVATQQWVDDTGSSRHDKTRRVPGQYNQAGGVIIPTLIQNPG